MRYYLTALKEYMQQNREKMDLTTKARISMFFNLVVFNKLTLSL